ncbi:MAG: DUF6152 family protein [Micropepsaceae bacterium]
MFSKTLCFVGIAASLFAIPAFGHHSMAMFDQTQVQSIRGTVTDFEWVNPHSWLHLTVNGQNGNEERWSITGGSPRNMSFIGWTADTVQPGDEIEVGFHPARDGSRVGVLSTITLPDGTELCNGGACRERLNVEIPEDAPFVQ